MAAADASDGAVLPRSSASILPVVTLLGLLFSWLLAAVSKTVSDPYMVPKTPLRRPVSILSLTVCCSTNRQDEVFHIPQAQKYCEGRFDEWDPKITTFPGLYLASTLYAKAAASLHLGAFCSVSVLRSVNVLFALGNVVLCVLLRRHVAPQDPNALLHALRIAVFPPLFFLAFLFYTDGGATFFVLLMALLAQKVDLLRYPPARGSFMLSAMSGAVAVLFRQTNIIWVFFVAGTVVVRCVELAHSKFIYGSLKEETGISGTSSVTHSSSLRVFINFVSVVVSNLPSILLIVWPFVVIVAGFIGFLLTNGGIVVGDKSNHEVTFHGAQVLYFIVVAASGFGLSLIAPSQLKKCIGSVRRYSGSGRGVLSMIFLLAVTVGVVHCFSPVHKFMLADNRHYTFYVWRKFFLKHELAKFLPSPFYLFFGWRCWDELDRRRSPLWKLVYALAVCLVLIPSPLVEPRYYCVPFIILHLNTGNQSAFHLWVVTAVYMGVNALTLYIFMYRPYNWVDGSTARFMW
ncbi:glucosyltransferase [Phytophthora pseudosyringae]|uniref:Dol-P-Glc:Glc(2)Man(9)GlcNAc(2)-PP-Dol alpha-1,2-glucosyltransferase n=1 Tax=Phytophthora pseudosyringae TaxID=221518 RepID=A0A8T1WHV5_9STRA|nr:glucosyltransferase [Phytophthora pseudosyringae]